MKNRQYLRTKGGPAVHPSYGIQLFHFSEWAENAKITEVLRGLSVDYAQGYGVSQPQKVQWVATA